jgi:hypothetical protein
MGSYDVGFDDYDESGTGYAGEEPKRGIYDGVLVSLQDHTSASSGAEGLKWVFEITEGSYKGWRGYVYSNLDSTKWRTQEIVKAIQGGSEKAVKIETTEKGTDSKTVKKAKRVRLNIKVEKYDDEPRGRIRNILPYENVSDSSGGGSNSDEPGGGKKKKKNKGDEPPF